MNRGYRLCNRNHAFFHCIRANSCSHIAAVGLIIHLALAYNNLANQIFHINSRLLTLPYNNNLIVGGNGTAHAINLFRIRITHGLEENAVPLLPVLRKVFLVKHAALAGAAAHKYCLKCSHVAPPHILSILHSILFVLCFHFF